ncbi:MAG: hypothetical protein EOP82_09665 [Variovorax sp.]|nr:MAG: hypothetical protein EOP82_09665 [Variovorax sp.]
MSAVLQDTPLTLEMIEPVNHPAPAVQRTGNVATLPAQGPMSHALAFLQAGGTIDQMRDILALQREFEAGEAKKAYVAAMARFKKNPPKILKDKRVYFQSEKGTTDYWHATLGNVAEAVIEGLAQVGISHSWTPERKGDRIHVTCTLTHEQGHSESITLDGPLDSTGLKNNIQQMASTTTYLSRYTLLMITGLAVKDELMPDDDGFAGAQAAEEQALARKQQQHIQGATATYTQADFSANCATWRSHVEAGRLTPAQIIAKVQTKAPLTDAQIKTINSWKKA